MVEREEDFLHCFYVNEENNVHSNVMSDLPFKKRVSDFLASLVDNKVGREYRFRYTIFFHTKWVTI